MNKKIQNQIVYWLGVVIVGLFLGLSLQFVRAWTEPTEAPPNGNLGAPLNTGSIDQSKSAGLNLYGADHGLMALGSTYGAGGYETDTAAQGLLGYNGAGVAGYQQVWGPYGASEWEYHPWGALGWNGYGVFGQQYWGGPYGALGYNGAAGYFANGPLVSEGDFISRLFRDLSDPNFYVDPDSSSRMNRIDTTGDVCSWESGSAKCLSQIGGGGSLDSKFNCQCRHYMWDTGLLSSGLPSPYAFQYVQVDMNCGTGWNMILRDRHTGGTMEHNATIYYPCNSSEQSWP